VDFYLTILEACGIKTSTKPDGVSRLPLYKGKKQKVDSFVFTQIDNKAGGKKAPMRSNASPMRSIKNLEYNYIFNAWAYTNAIHYTNNEGITMKAMQEAAKSNEEIKNRVDFFRRRPLEEFYDIRKDPDCLNNLISDPKYTGEIQRMSNELKKWMKEYKDPLLFVYENRDHKEIVMDKLYQLYPDLKMVDAKTDLIEKQ
jgi:N-sulfoglucosamine sulfohydrolase